MPVLPIIDLLILLASTSLGFGFILKVIEVTTNYRPAPLGFSSIDFVVIASICFAFALTLVARTWMKLNEPRLFALRSEAMAQQARIRAADLDHAVAADAEASESLPRTASADHR